MASPERRNRFHLPSINIGTIIFGAIFVYIVITVLLYLTASHVASYQVISGPLSKNQTYTALAVRSEQVVTAETGGYVTYYTADDAKVRKNGVVYGIGQERITADTSALDEESMRSISNDIAHRASNFTSNDFHSIYSYKYELTGSIVSNTLLNSLPILTEGVSGTPATLAGQTIYGSPTDGIVVYSTDGLENVSEADLSPDLFHTKSYDRTSLKTSEKISAGEAVYKLIDSENWSIYLPITAAQIVNLDGRKSVRVKFLKDNATQVGNLTLLPAENGTDYYARIDFTNGLLRYAEDRYLQVELVTNMATGLKIPLSAIVKKEFFKIPEEYATMGGDSRDIGFIKVTTDEEGNENAAFITTTLYEYKDGFYYVDKRDFSEGDRIIKDSSATERFTVGESAILEGVYNMNRGYALFRKVTVIDKNEEYCLVETGTRYGIAQYDYIVLDSAKVNEDEILTKQ